MRALITGAAGFIGHHLLGYLASKTDWEITILDRLDHSGNLNRIDQLNLPKGRARFVFHDLRAQIGSQLARQIGEHDYIFHMAASTHVDRSLLDPALFVQDNVVATCNLLDFARATGCKKFFNFSTDEVFGPAAEGHAHKEDEPYRPSNPYSATKAGAASLGCAYWVSFKVPVITTYTMNNFGERQHPEKLIPRTIRCLIEDEPMPVYAERINGQLVPVGSRYWLHAGNTASALHYLASYGMPGQAYNIIGFDEWRNWDLIHYVAELAGKKLKTKLVDFYGIRPGHDVRYALDGSKLAALGWKPEANFAQSMRRTVQFSLEHREWV